VAGVALLTVAALGVGGSRAGEGGTAADGRLPYLLASAVLAVVLLAAISARDGRRPLSRAASAAVQIVALLLPVIVLGLIAFVAMKDERARGVGGLLPAPQAVRGATATPPPRPTATPAAAANEEGAPVWPTVLALALVAAAVVLLVRRRRDFKPPPFSLPGRRSAPQGEPSPAAIADPAGIADPRAAVVAAFARMEADLRRAGPGRRRGEGPIEFTERVAAARPGVASPVRRLARAYAPARFSEHPIDAAMRRDALEALDAVRRGLTEETVS
jgi:hypothetical protein